MLTGYQSAYAAPEVFMTEIKCSGGGTYRVYSFYTDGILTHADYYGCDGYFTGRTYYCQRVVNYNPIVGTPTHTGNCDIGSVNSTWAFQYTGSGFTSGGGVGCDGLYRVIDSTNATGICN
jgi:hypothetical protein